MNNNSSTYFIVGALVLGLGFLGILIFSRQGQPTSFERELITTAESLGMDGDKFFEDYSNEEIRARVAEDIEYADSLSVNSTPSVFINEERVESTADYEVFRGTVQAAIDNAEELPITLAVFEDYQCPFCANFFPIPYFVEAEFGENVIVERYHLPLENIHPLARRYAYAAEAAEEQGKYYEMSKAIFETETDVDYSQIDALLSGEPIEETGEQPEVEIQPEEGQNEPVEEQPVENPEETVENTEDQQ